jgi:hypothetical protein
MQRLPTQRKCSPIFRTRDIASAIVLGTEDKDRAPGRQRAVMFSFFNIAFWLLAPHT